MWSTELGVCFLPLAFKNHCPRQHFVQVGFPPKESTHEEQIGGGGDVRMKPTELLCACRLMMKSRKLEGLGRSGFGQGSLHASPIMSREPRGTLCSWSTARARSCLHHAAWSSASLGHPSVPRGFLNCFPMRSPCTSLSPLFGVNIRKWQ